MGTATALRDIARLYHRDIVAAGKQPHFFILMSFLATFVAVRALTHAIRRGRVRLLHDLTAHGTHIHHLVWGILLLLATGYAAIAFGPSAPRGPLAVLFGVGAALTLDEFALWLHLEDVYWAREGRDSIDAVVVATVVLGLFVLGRAFWVGADRVLLRLLGLP